MISSTPVLFANVFFYRSASQRALHVLTHSFPTRRASDPRKRRPRRIVQRGGQPRRLVAPPFPISRHCVHSAHAPAHFTPDTNDKAHRGQRHTMPPFRETG